MRIVVKVGSVLLGSKLTTSGLNETFIGHFVQQIGALYQDGHEIVLVTSGAVLAGMIDDEGYPTSRAAMVGQIKLMCIYHRFFEQLGIRIGQALYTYDDIREDSRNFLTKERLLQGFEHREVTVINANDSVMPDELQALSYLADNDQLAAKVAVLIESDALFILTNVDGLYRRYGVPNTELIKEVPLINDEIIQLAQETNSSVSKGGMASKIKAAKSVTAHGIKMVIANGKIENVLLKIMYDNDCPGTTFLSQKTQKTLRV